MDEPGREVIRAYEAPTEGRIEELLDLLNEEGMTRAVERRIGNLSRITESPLAAKAVQTNLWLKVWGLSTSEELVTLAPREVLRRGLAARPLLGEERRCEVLETVYEAEGVVAVRVRVTWPHSPPELDRTPIIRLHRSPAGWKILPEAMPSCILPGFENMLIADRF